MGVPSTVLLVTSAFAADFSGPVIGVLDGDTIEVLHNNHAERIHHNGIDCPEKGQAFGRRAKQATSELVFGKEIALQTHDLDKYGRTIADVMLPDGINVNRTLVKEGWCWWYRKYTPLDTDLEQLEKSARDAQKGLRLIQHQFRRGSTGKQDEDNHSTYQTWCPWTLKLKVVRLLVVHRCWELSSKTLGPLPQLLPIPSSATAESIFITGLIVQTTAMLHHGIE